MKKLLLVAGLCFLSAHLEALEPAVQVQEQEGDKIDMDALSESLAKVFEQLQQEEAGSDVEDLTPVSDSTPANN